MGGERSWRRLSFCPPPTAQGPLTSPHKHTWKPAMVGPSGPGLSRGDVSISPVLGKPGALGSLHRLGGRGVRGKGLGAVYPRPPRGSQNPPSPIFPGPGKGIQEQPHPSPRPAAQMETVWKEKVSCPRSRSGSSQDCALFSTP